MSPERERLQQAFAELRKGNPASEMPGANAALDALELTLDALLRIAEAHEEQARDVRD